MALRTVSFGSVTRSLATNEVLSRQIALPSVEGAQAIGMLPFGYKIFLEGGYIDQILLESGDVLLVTPYEPDVRLLNSDYANGIIAAI